MGMAAGRAQSQPPQRMLRSRGRLHETSTPVSMAAWRCGCGSPSCSGLAASKRYVSGVPSRRGTRLSISMSPNSGSTMRACDLASARGHFEVHTHEADERKQNRNHEARGPCFVRNHSHLNACSDQGAGYMKRRHQWQWLRGGVAVDHLLVRD